MAAMMEPAAIHPRFRHKSTKLAPQTWPALAPWRVPSRLSRLCCFPQSKVLLASLFTGLKICFTFGRQGGIAHRARLALAIYVTQVPGATVARGYSNQVELCLVLFVWFHARCRWVHATYRSLCLSHSVCQSGQPPVKELIQALDASFHI
eukprot:GHUV01036935.1.p1 GENE.GHUV01036935.1~~GHUV01036935.1.p1  ORF type:complete len:150 (+),score=11.83 GHUV01036935.1:208-657(+)